MRRFAVIELIRDRIPDGTIILTFHHLLEEKNSESRYAASQDFDYETVINHLKEREIAIKQGAIIEATLIAAPSFTLTEAGGLAWRSH
jgi:IS5 family transposase